MRRVVLLLLLAVSLQGQDAATLALSVGDASLDAAAIAERLKSADALTRATAARMALVRNLAGAVPQLRAALAAEKNAEAAREEMRALVILGVDDDIAFAREQLARFPASIDGDFAAAVARLGAPRAMDLYLKHGKDLRAPGLPMLLALWGRSAHATPIAARYLGAKDEASFIAIVRAFTESRVALDAGIATAALGSSSPAIRTSVIWHLVETNAAEPSRIPESIREAATAAREGAPMEEAFGREVLRRMLGTKAAERKEWIEWMRTPEGRAKVPARPEVMGFFTFGEQDALIPEVPSDQRAAKQGETAHGGTPVATPPFMLPLMLPPGLPEAMMKQAGCSAGWLGVAKVTVDRAGRVQTVDLENVGADSGCKSALEAMMRLSLAEPVSFVAPLAVNDLLVVETRGDVPCMDEGLVDNARHAGAYRPGGDVKVPVVKKRQEPIFPESVRQAMKGPALVVMEARISKTGCVRDIRLLKQAPWGALNGAAVMALSKWKFDPGTLDGVPVDVIFNLTISFRLN